MCQVMAHRRLIGAPSPGELARRLAQASTGDERRRAARPPRLPEWIQRWLRLSQTPTFAANDRWVIEHNRRCDPAKPSAPSAAATGGALGCSWSEMLRVAQGRTTLETLGARDLADFNEGRPNPLGLVWERVRNRKSPGRALPGLSHSSRSSSRLSPRNRRVARGCCG